MKRTLSVLLAFVLLISCAAVFAGCSGGKGSEYPVTVGEVTIDKEPEAIVVLNDCAADVITYIGYDIKMVGRSIDCDQDFLKVVPSVGTPDNPAIDTMVQKGADLVIADSSMTEKEIEKIEAQGIKVIVFDRPDDQSALKQLYSDLGAVLGGNVTGREKGDNAYKELFDTLDQFKTATTGVIKTAAYLYQDVNGRLCTFTQGSLAQKIFNYNGAMNVFKNQTAEAVDPNELRLGSPTYIFYDNEAVLDYLRNDESLSGLSALVNGRTHMIPLKNFYRQGKTFEDTVYDMIDYLNKMDEATKDEATPDEYDEYDSDYEGGYDGADYDYGN